MEKTPARKKRVRTVIYLDPVVRRQLKREHGETDRPGGAIVEEALEAYFEAKSHASQHASHPI